MGSTVVSSVSDCSSDSEFVTLDSISQVSAAPTMARMHPSEVVKKGVGRGSMLPGRRPSRQQLSLGWGKTRESDVKEQLLVKAVAVVIMSSL